MWTGIDLAQNRDTWLCDGNAVVDLRVEQDDGEYFR